MMLSTELRLGQIAISCGLFDQPHLSRTFRSIVGETPTAWRRAGETPNAWRRAHRDALDHVSAASFHGPIMGHDAPTHPDTAAIQEAEIAA
jgi:AraC-like DNA-binding protein